jgi:hypothetical protein
MLTRQVAILGRRIGGPSKQWPQKAILGRRTGGRSKPKMLETQASAFRTTPLNPTGTFA